ncbi:hypothetical protein CQR49_0909 [Bifidobacterium pseudolongum subsp. pseudolongum]|nr:hypothetical protein CQR49_0909 [Bifidobacterium pseudolongum subsp. pseudolongum]
MKATWVSATEKRITFLNSLVTFGIGSSDIFESIALPIPDQMVLRKALLCTQSRSYTITSAFVLTKVTSCWSGLTNCLPNGVRAYST